MLYYKVPGWPLGFGDKAKAKELLQKALALNPQGIDPNFFYAEYLVETKQADEAVPYLEKALQAPPRPGRQIADTGRREEVRALLAKIKSQLSVGDHALAVGACAVAQRQAVQRGDALHDRHAQAAAAFGLAVDAVEAFAQVRQRLGRQRRRRRSRPPAPSAPKRSVTVLPSGA